VDLLFVTAIILPRRPVVPFIRFLRFTVKKNHLVVAIEKKLKNSKKGFIINHSRVAPTPFVYPESIIFTFAGNTRCCIDQACVNVPLLLYIVFHPLSLSLSFSLSYIRQQLAQYTKSIGRIGISHLYFECI
jgi:hypothetical protein